MPHISDNNGEGGTALWNSDTSHHNKLQQQQQVSTEKIYYNEFISLFDAIRQFLATKERH